MKNIFDGINHWCDEFGFIINETSEELGGKERFQVSASFLRQVALTVAFASTTSLVMANAHTRIFVDADELKGSSFLTKLGSHESDQVRELRAIPKLTKEQIAFFSGISTSGAFTLAANLGALGKYQTKNSQG